jgi:hypothetical protein
MKEPSESPNMLPRGATMSSRVLRSLQQAHLGAASGLLNQAVRPLAEVAGSP